MTPVVGRDDIERAARRIEPHVRRTPVIDPGDAFFPVAAAPVLKLELLQHSGSFKPRGAMHRALTSEIPRSGLIAASGGNHGLAVAWVARRLGVPAEIFVPEVSPATKVDKIRAQGATVHVAGALYDDALESARARQRETGALDIHAYDHPDTVAGAGSIGLEIEAQVGPVDTVVVAVGGGGLAAGVAAWFRGMARIITVEPESSSCYATAVAAGRPVDVTVKGVAADSLGARRIGAVNWAELRASEAEPVVVADEAIREAQRRFWRDLQLVVEPGGATAAAALSSGAYVPDVDERVVVIVCGANCAPESVTGGS